MGGHIERGLAAERVAGGGQRPLATAQRRLPQAKYPMQHVILGSQKCKPSAPDQICGRQGVFWQHPRWWQQQQQQQQEGKFDDGDM